MKKLLLASAFALFGTFAMANDARVKLEVETSDVVVELEKECQAFDSLSDCGGQFIACKEKGTTWNIVALLIFDAQLCQSEKEMGL